MKKALITGINGQDGSYLSELLIDKGYEVHGILRRHSVAENQDARIASLDIKTHYGDLTDEVSLFKILNAVKPDEIYNLGAMSHVGISSQMPAFTIKTNSLSVISLLEFTKEICPECRVYQASSSEMFGNSTKKSIDENTNFDPASPYGISKVGSHYLVKLYRKAYNLDCCSGILFNPSKIPNDETIPT